MGAEWRRRALARVEARMRLPPALLDRLRRGTAAVHSRPGLADVPPAVRELRRLLFDVQVEDDLWTRSALLRAALPHQLSHLWIDFRNLRDAFMREHGSDYFQNSRAATYIQ